MTRTQKTLVTISHLTKQFKIANRWLTAVRNMNLTLFEGETLGLVGESGCGKSTAGRTILRLYEPTSGHVILNGVDLNTLSQRELKAKRCEMQMIFQDPYASLNPRMTVQDIIAEPLDIHKIAKGKERKRRVAELLNLVGLSANHMGRFPHEFSGGQRQRIGIARALAVEPKFLICDEPISALDVSIQAQIVNLLKRLRDEKRLTYLFIAHDLSMVKYLCDRVAVMYLGEIVELAPSELLYGHPLHPYTQALLSSIPIPDPEVERKRKRVILKGEVPNVTEQMRGCPFATRCPLATDLCHTQTPQWREIVPSHFVACHYAQPQES